MAGYRSWDYRGEPVQVRFMAKVDTQHHSGCWVWTAGVFGQGYGQFQLDGRPVRAHRLAFELFVGEIPADTQVHHTCDNRLCVKPDHLWLGTQQDNIQDMFAKGRSYLQRGGRCDDCKCALPASGVCARCGLDAKEKV